MLSGDTIAPRFMCPPGSLPLDQLTEYAQEPVRRCAQWGGKTPAARCLAYGPPKAGGGGVKATRHESPVAPLCRRASLPTLQGHSASGWLLTEVVQLLRSAPRLYTPPPCRIFCGPRVNQLSHQNTPKSSVPSPGRALACPCLDKAHFVCNARWARQIPGAQV